MSENRRYLTGSSGASWRLYMISRGLPATGKKPKANCKIWPWKSLIRQDMNIPKKTVWKRECGNRPAEPSAKRTFACFCLTHATAFSRMTSILPIWYVRAANRLFCWQTNARDVYRKTAFTKPIVWAWANRFRFPPSTAWVCLTYMKP